MRYVPSSKPYHLLSGLAIIPLLSLGCEVTNPGRLQDVFLNQEETWEGLVNGMGRALSDVLDEGALTSAVLAREIHPTGSVRIPILSVRFGTNVVRSQLPVRSP